VGGIQALTGPLAIPGKSAKEGMGIAKADIDPTLSSPVGLSVKDDSGKVKDARSVVQSYISGNTPVIVGGIASNICLALSDLVEQNKIPLNMTAGGDVKLTEKGKNWTFRYPNPSSAQEQMSIVKFLDKKTNVSNVALIMADYAYGRNSAKYFEKYAKSKGISIDSKAFIPLSSKNFVPDLNKINNNAIDAINIVFPGPNAISLIEQLHQNGLFKDNVITSIATVTSEAYKKALGDKLLGMYITGPDPTADTFKTLDKAVNKKYNTSADVFHVTGHDSLAMPLKAIESANSLDPKSIRDSMRKSTYTGAYGTNLKFNSNGLNVAFQETITQFTKKNGDVTWHNKVYKPKALNPPV